MKNDYLKKEESRLGFILKIITGLNVVIPIQSGCSFLTSLKTKLFSTSVFLYWFSGNL